jgi:hypothetical protein
MDLLSIVQAIWRHKLASIPVILLTAVGMFYVYAIKPPVYQATANLLLLSPPGAPTASQIAADPKLGKVSSNNPYVNFQNLAVVADAVQHVVTSAASAQALANAGADPRYLVALSTDYGAPPILQITGTASSAQAAIRTAILVTQAAKADLQLLQQKQGVNPFYMIKSTELVPPAQAQRSVSGKLRTLIAVLGLGTILLFVVVSVTDVLEKRRRASSSIDADTRPRQDANVRPREDKWPAEDADQRLRESDRWRAAEPGAGSPAYGGRRERPYYAERQPPRPARQVPSAAKTDPDPLGRLPGRPPGSSGSRNP